MQPDYWHWAAGALVLLIAEMVLPGFYLLWIGLAMLVVALLVLVWPGAPFELQLVLFAAASVASIVGWRSWQARHPDVSDQPHLNDRGQQYVGKLFTLDAPIVNGAGKVRIGDSVWNVAGTDQPAGTTVRVVGADGVTLRVETA